MISGDEKDPFHIGIDIGGTFTDAVLQNGRTVWRGKAPTTPESLATGVLAACRVVSAEAGTTLEDLLPRVARFGLGTTAVTNVVAAQTGRRIGLLTTKGFEDLVPMSRSMRTPTDGWLLPPIPLVDPEMIVGVAERIDRNGTVLEAMRTEDVLAAAGELLGAGDVEALVVSFLWSCANSDHERQAVECLAKECPELPIYSGSSLHPLMREYERTQFALLNAYTGGAFLGIRALVDELQQLGLRRPPLLVHSGGGAVSVSEGERLPASLLESGPAAGVIGALAVCKTANVVDAVVGDIGGTSFDIAIISGGEAGHRTRGNVMGIWTALSMIDIESIGSGGGSIGWVDKLGILRVGPLSAGASPGPACYGRGGRDATVTDALTVLGYIDPERFLGGTMALDSSAALEAFERLGNSLGCDPYRAATGVVEVATANMVRGVRAEFAQRGIDPRPFTFIATGGCGGLFAAAIARDVGIKRVLFPALGSVLSAFGAATAEMRRERTQPVGLLLPAASDALEGAARRAEAQVRADLDADGTPHVDQHVRLQVDVRFYRQKSEISIEWTGGFDEENQAHHIDRFKEVYITRYGNGALVSGAPVEVVSVRAIGIGHTIQAVLTPADRLAAGTVSIDDRREIRDGHGGSREVDTFVEKDLLPGHSILGPAIYYERDTTIYIPPGCRAEMDNYRSIALEVN